MFILEEAYIKAGTATPLNQIGFDDFNQAFGVWQGYIKQSDDHFVILFDGNRPWQQAIATK